MKIQSTDGNSRVELRLGLRGATMSWMRPAVGGGWYPDNSITMTWPWMKWANRR
jgi:hypothetical protein